MEKQDRIVERFLEYVQIDSPTREEKEFKDRLKLDLEELGLEVYEDDAGEKVGSNSGNLIGKLKGDGNQTILFSAHMDTVSPGRGIKPEIRDGIIYSDGTTVLGADDKAGVASIIEMLTILKEENISHHNLEISFNIYEEGGLFGSKNLDYSMFEADFGIIVDSSSAPGYTILEAPAQNKINVKFKGKTAHAGVAPEAGISAIQIAAEAISNMKLLRIDEETTANIGFIGGGGPTNIVTDEVEIKAEARSLDNDKLKAQTDHMVQCVKDAQAKYGIEAEIEVEEAYKAFRVTEDSIPAQAVKAACERAGLEFVPGKSGGGSDANNFNQNGIPSVNIGVGYKNAHTTEEFIPISALHDMTKLLLEIAKA
ncbi:MAG: M20/M25/M40 family metallo-hydrolase [Tissierellia bacterium]|nr:M20/M25/M40 family metallo-hydrolase [Tissierellia bacterium]